MAKMVRLESKDNEGNTKVLFIKKPTHTELTEAQFYSSSIFNKAKNAGACLRSKLDEYLKKEGLWTDEDQNKVDELTFKVENNLKILKTGKHITGEKVKLSEARQLAIETRRDRWRLNLLLGKKREHDAYTVEGQAENARFDYLVSMCVFDEDDNRFYSSIDDYYDKQEELYSVEAATKLASMSFNLEDNWEKKLPENEFLLKYKFVDENLRYVDKDGKFVNADGHHVNEDGALINSDGKLVDKDGKVIEDEVIEAEFLDDVYTVTTV